MAYRATMTKPYGKGNNGDQVTATTSQALTIKPPRFPYMPEVKEKFDIDEEAWRALVEAIFPNAQSVGSIILALSYCKKRTLDVFKRNVHIVPIWDKDKRCYVDTIWPGIGELRTTAFRTGHYAGRDATQFGEDITSTWKVDGREVSLVHPEWAQVTVYRMVEGQRVAFAGPPVFWLETFASTRDGCPNSMWMKRPRGQIDKCAEGAALRAAFPEEWGDTPSSDEGPVIYQNSMEPLGAPRAKEPVQEPGVAGCAERMRKAVESVAVPPETKEPPAKPVTHKPKEPPDLLADLEKFEQPAPGQGQHQWQCENGHVCDKPEPQEGTVCGVCPTCGTDRIRRLS
jgi:phage recombination protein Bet